MLISGRWVPSPSLPSRHDPAEDCSNNQPCRCTHGPICGGHHNRGRPVSSWRSACAQPGHARKQRPETLGWAELEYCVLSRQSSLAQQRANEQLKQLGSELNSVLAVDDVRLDRRSNLEKKHASAPPTHDAPLSLVTPSNPPGNSR